MSWSSRFGGWGGRFSPFGRSPNAGGEVSDGDFSYITSDDLARSQADQTPSGASTRDTDVLVLKNKKMNYPVHFPAHSIDRGELTVGDIRAAAAGKVGTPKSEAHRMKILYKGRNLSNDSKAAREEGLRSDGDHELMLVVPDATRGGESSSEEEEEESTVDGADGSKKKIRRRKKKSKSKKKNGDLDTPPLSTTNSSMLNPDATYAPSSAPPPPRQRTPQPAAAPQTPLQKLDALASVFHTKFVPDCIQFTASPPTDKAKRDFDHKKLTETILAQILLKLDAVETEGDPAARQRRKDIVKEVQGMLNRLDEVVKA
ncbi:hypothetical protein EJ08DRAFT_669622 [Tothia fuscella]|uniref:BAG domain-containing protein n=1 Tax=Tothia fuscella TaxID=1048955 RepID=A0A9P4NUT2_9PEZI|nr:hypothetical protein EJ08DRAFT_669622 [Tothia fuscella]